MKQAPEIYSICMKMLTVFLCAVWLLVFAGVTVAGGLLMAGESDMEVREASLLTIESSLASSSTDFGNIDAYIEAEMSATRLPGLALSIVQGDQIVHLRGFGRADSSGRSVTPQTPFLIASVTKPLTAIAVMQLVEAGKLDLDAPVQRYLPQFTVADPKAGAKITIRQLLSHTSGLPTLTDDDRMAFDHKLGESALTERIWALHRTPLSAAPGERFEYSNAGYATLALLIQTVSGQSYEQYLQEHLYGPLSMEHSFVAKSEAERDGLASGHRFFFGFPVSYDWSYTSAELGAGFTYASAEDLARLLIALLNGGRFEELQLLSGAGVATMLTPQVTFSQGETESAYALGWFIKDAGEMQIVSHAGVAPNYRAELILVPERQLGIVVLMNGESQLQPRIGHIVQGVTGLLLDRELPTTSGNGTLPSLFHLVVGGSVVQASVLGGSVYLWGRRRAGSRQWQTRLFGLGGLFGVLAIAHLLWGIFCLILVPRLLMWPLSDLVFKLPDFGFTLIANGTLALAWTVVVPLMMFTTVDQQRPALVSGLPATN